MWCLVVDLIKGTSPYLHVPYLVPCTIPCIYNLASTIPITLYHTLYLYFTLYHASYLYFTLYFYVTLYLPCNFNLANVLSCIYIYNYLYLMILETYDIREKFLLIQRFLDKWKLKVPVITLYQVPNFLTWKSLMALSSLSKYFWYQ